MKLDIENLKESNEFLNTLLDNITSAIFIADKDVKIQSFNDSFRTLFYKNEDLVLGEYCGNALGCVYAVEENADCGSTKHCQTCTLRLSLLATFFKKIPADREILSRQFLINDKLILKHFQFSTRNISFNQQDMILVIVDDITEQEEQKKALAEKNKKLEELNNQRNELLGMAAHDLRNPLTVISSFSDMILETYDEFNPEKIKEVLNILKKTSHFSLQLLNDILDFSKIESGTVELRKIKLDYIRFVKENILQNEFLSVKKNIPIVLVTPDEEIAFNFDPQRMDQVLNNLISNSIKYSFPGNKITIRISREDGHVVTSIEDRGQGIPEKDLPHIFKPFRLTSVRTTQNEKSTGLGLAIVKKIIEFHKGKLSVASIPEQGSIFTFYLPLE